MAKDYFYYLFEKMNCIYHFYGFTNRKEQCILSILTSSGLEGSLLRGLMSPLLELNLR